MESTLGKGKMAAMARLLAGTCSERTEEEVGQEKLAAQSIQTELLEADEANLLDEEDMHVFDCMPMMDVLHLVCCNNCKKPVKASQYAAHSERCRSLNWSEEVYLELDGGTGRKKPPRKGRKRNPAVNKSIAVGANGRLGSLDGNDTAVFDSVAYQANKMTSSSKRVKRKSASTDPVSVKNGSVRRVRTANCSGPVVPPEKRTKIEATHLKSKGQEALVGVTTNHSIDHQKTTYYPAPLATKMYYSQRNQRLRFALNQLYNEAPEKAFCSESQKIVDENAMLPSRGSSPTSLVHNPPSSELSNEKDADLFATVPEPDQILVEGSEHCLEDSGYVSAMDFSNQFIDNNFSTLSLSGDVCIGKTKSRYLPTAYAYTGNSGTSLGGIQQPSGSVPVV